MANVLGVGGVFFRSPDPQKTRQWYADVLGLTIQYDMCSMFNHSGSAEAKGPGAMTIWSPYAPDTDYFGPSGQHFMINLMVDDLDAMLTALKGKGVEPVKPRMDEPYGSFVWIEDCDGRWVELWEPKPPTE